MSHHDIGDMRKAQHQKRARQGHITQPIINDRPYFVDIIDNWNDQERRKNIPQKMANSTATHHQN